MNTRTSFSSNPIFLALTSRTTLALGLALPMLAASWGCSSKTALDNFSCSCAVTDTNGNSKQQALAYCGDAEDDGNDETAQEEATTWAQSTCGGKNPSDTCTCSCTDLGTTCTTPTG
jgi:hypothetical protein